MIFHLEVKVYIRRYGNLCPIDSFFSDVYTSYKKALHAGISEVNGQIIKLQADDICYRNGSIEEFIREMIHYEFVIREVRKLDEHFDKFKHFIGLSTPDEFTILKDMDLYELCKQNSSEIEYRFDYQGNLIERWEYRGLGYHRMPSSYNENAGSLYSIGDVVRVKSINQVIIGN